MGTDDHTREALAEALLDEFEGDAGFSLVVEGTTLYFGPDYEGPVKFPRGMYGKNGRLQRMGQLLAQGHSMHYILREMGGWRGTVIKLRRVMEIVLGKELQCPCGQPSRHRGLCVWRRETYPKWNAYLASMPERREQIALRHSESPPPRGARGRFAARL